MQYAMLTAFAALLAVGQVLFKKAAIASLGRDMPFALLSGWMIAALTLYSVATALWVWILRSVPLSEAYPFTALGFIFVPLLSKFLFGDVIEARYWMGTTLIMAGIAVTCR